MKHFLPCRQCEAQLIVTSKDAGRDLVCETCGAQQQAPSLGAIRQLPVAEAAVAAPGRKWSTLQGAAFGGGLILLVAGLIGLYVYYPRYQSASADLQEILGEGGEFPDFSDLTPVETTFKEMPASQLWSEWRVALRQNTDVYMPTEPRRILDLKEMFYRSILLYGGLAIAGVVGMLVSFLLP